MTEKFLRTENITKRKEIIHSLLTQQKLPSQFVGNVASVVQSWVQGIGIPILTVGIALFLKIELSNLIGENILFLLFFVPIVISTLISGIYSGIIATLLGSAASGFFLLQALSINFFPYREIITLVIYTLEGFVISYIIELQRRAQISLAEIEERFRLLLTNTGDYAILFLNPFGTIVAWNSGAQKLFKYKEQEILGNHFSILFTPEDRKKGLPEKEYKTALTRNRFTDENYLIRKDKTIFWASGFTSSLWDKNNNIKGFVKIVRDMTQSHETEQQKEDFIGIASHELKTPVASMQIYTQLLQKYYSHNPLQKEPALYLSRIVNQLKYLGELMDTLLDISHIQQGTVTLQKEQTHITSFIDRIIENIQTSDKQHHIQRVGSIRKKIFLDRQRIEEVLVNLLTNAMKYSPKATSIIVRLETKKTSIRIHVQDFGIGIPKDKLGKIFERFYRTEAGEHFAQGMGLGLYISSKIAKAHKGSLQVKSTVGKGSVFTLILPS